MVLPKSTCLTLSHTCFVHALLILGDACLIAVYILPAVYCCDIYYLLGNCMASVHRWQCTQSIDTHVRMFIVVCVVEMCHIS